MEQLVARRAHNPKVVGSSPASATQKPFEGNFRGFFRLQAYQLVQSPMGDSLKTFKSPLKKDLKSRYNARYEDN